MGSVNDPDKERKNLTLTWQCLGLPKVLLRVVLSVARVPVSRDKRKSKDPENVSSAIQLQGILPRFLHCRRTVLFVIRRKCCQYNRLQILRIDARRALCIEKIQVPPGTQDNSPARSTRRATRAEEQVPGKLRNEFLPCAAGPRAA